MKLKVFGSVDTFLPGNAGNGLRDDAQAAANQLGGAGYAVTGTVETRAAIGGRLGVALPVNSALDLGFSAGYIAGPNSDATLVARSGLLSATLSDQREIHFFRFLLEPRLNVPLGEKSAFHLGGGLGVAQGSVDETFTCAGNACLIASQEKSSTWSGFTWEVSPSVTMGHGVLGIRYAGFPKFNGNANNSKIEWSTIGFFGGFEF